MTVASGYLDFSRFCSGFSIIYSYFGEMRVGLMFFLHFGINLLSYVDFSLALNVIVTVYESCVFGEFFVPFLFFKKLFSE